MHIFSTPFSSPKVWNAAEVYVLRVKFMSLILTEFVMAKWKKKRTKFYVSYTEKKIAYALDIDMCGNRCPF